MNPDDADWVVTVDFAARSDDSSKPTVAGLTERFTLPNPLPPLRLLLVWDNLAGHKTPAMVLWLCRHGIMPLDTPLGGSGLNMAESIQRVLKRQALAGQHPESSAQIGAWV